ncbi:MAG: aminoacyl-tRNA hydrolase [Patescibacteria group bacterium]|jgi:PTH1 family peptidyl-tRNA hydrolase
MKLIAGLGNPGPKYAHTRHNIGFNVVDALARRLGTDLRDDKEFHAELGKTTHQHHRIYLAKPTTFMNDSGESVSMIARYYKIDPSNIWLVYDDIDIEFGAMKIKAIGSSAGHKGVMSVIEQLGTDRFPRFKFGIRPMDNEHLIQNNDTGDYVLNPWSAEQAAKLPELVGRTVEAIILALEQGLPTAMNHFN